MREKERERIFLIKNPQTLLSIKNKRIASPSLQFAVFLIYTISLIIDKIIQTSINQINLMLNNLITHKLYHVCQGTKKLSFSAFFFS